MLKVLPRAGGGDAAREGRHDRQEQRGPRSRRCVRRVGRIDQDLEQYRAYLGQLADPRTVTPEQAAQIIAKAKPLYHLSGGLHSAEVGPSRC